MSNYPKVKDPNLIGEYPALVNAGGGYVWDEVLEYRVWCHPYDGAPDIEDGNDYYYAFEAYEMALEFSKVSKGSREPLALIIQEEYIEEPEPGQYIHVKEQRLTEWPVEFLLRPKRTSKTIPDFLSPNAPSDRLKILRGQI
jgi:hypothetical protein